jgi:uncharacterized delta-60 repeat protein
MTVLVGMALAATPAPGDLDVSYGTAGKTITQFPGSTDDRANAAVLQADGKLVVAGSSGIDFGFSRYNTDGSLDLTFGPGGTVTHDFGGPQVRDSAQAIALQPDGKLVIAGWSSAGQGTDVALTRYNSDGTPDPSFGPGSSVITTFPGLFAMASAVVLQPDGKIVIAGQNLFTSGDANSLRFLLIRYTVTGSLDTSFGSGGIVQTAFAQASEATSLVRQPDGKLVAAGGTGPDFALARYNVDGSLDPSFGSGGKTTVNVGPASRASSLVLQADGKLVVGGRTDSPANDFGLARLNSNGSLDSTFGTGGKVVTDFNGGNDGLFALVLQADGKVVAAGGSNVGASRQFGLARYNLDGTLDTTFGTGGKVNTPVDKEGDVNALVTQVDGKILAAGLTVDDLNNVRFVVARYIAGNRNPVARCKNATVSTSGTSCTATATASLVNNGSTDPDGEVIACSIAPPGPFGVGASAVTLTCSDPAGATGSCSATVTVNDGTAPKFTFVPAAITITTCVNANIGQATATDNCGPATVTSNRPAKFNLGPTTVTWKATDASGNSVTATQLVTAELGDDTSCCPAGTNIMVGTEASNQLVGTSGSDCILGRGGDDVIDARDGNDYVSGGAGRDTIQGGNGDDTIFGGAGDDTITGGGGKNKINGGPGTDSCAVVPGQDTVTSCP